MRLRSVFESQYIKFSLLARSIIKRQLSGQHCIESDTKTPYIHQFWIIGLMFENFWSHVRGSSACSFSEGIIFDGDTESEVNDFYFFISVKHDIFRFYVSVADLLLFEIEES